MERRKLVLLWARESDIDTAQQHKYSSHVGSCSCGCDPSDLLQEVGDLTCPCERSGMQEMNMADS